MIIVAAVMVALGALLSCPGLVKGSLALLLLMVLLAWAAVAASTAALQVGSDGCAVRGRWGRGRGLGVCAGLRLLLSSLPLALCNRLSSRAPLVQPCSCTVVEEKVTAALVEEAKRQGAAGRGGVLATVGVSNALSLARYYFYGRWVRRERALMVEQGKWQGRPEGLPGLLQHSLTSAARPNPGMLPITSCPTSCAQRHERHRGAV
jgi:hypothetical protein